jgi:hypothetical protein
MTEDIFYFDDWVNWMLNNSDYKESDIMNFEEHYQNLLTFEENTLNFINYGMDNNK